MQHLELVNDIIRQATDDSPRTPGEDAHINLESQTKGYSCSCLDYILVSDRWLMRTLCFLLFAAFEQEKLLAVLTSLASAPSIFRFEHEIALDGLSAEAGREHPAELRNLDDGINRMEQSIEVSLRTGYRISSLWMASVCCYFHLPGWEAASVTIASLLVPGILHDVDYDFRESGELYWHNY